MCVADLELVEEDSCLVKGEGKAPGPVSVDLLGISGNSEEEEEEGPPLLLLLMGTNENELSLCVSDVDDDKGRSEEDELCSARSGRQTMSSEELTSFMQDSPGMPGSEEDIARRRVVGFREWFGMVEGGLREGVSGEMGEERVGMYGVGRVEERRDR